ncbi:lactoylglutathione lyase [Planctomycetaceae bacterium]|nr:lactoylglutathione lyase [Planctomycetaceae bacterium]
MGGDLDIWHVAIPVSDLARSEDFYVHKLGFALVGREESAQKRQIFVSVKPGGFTLVLFAHSRDALAMPRYPDHLAFECEYIEEFRARLVQAGLTYLPRVESLPNGTRRFALSDPDGVQLHFFQGRQVFEAGLKERT